MVALPASSQEVATSSGAAGQRTTEQRTTEQRSAADQILTMFGRFIGAGYIFYLLVCIPLIRDAATVTHPWWTPVALALFFGPGFVLCAASFTSRGRRHLRTIAASCAILYLVGLATWPIGWTGAMVDSGLPTWFTLFPALASLGAAVSMRPRWAFLHLALTVTVCQIVNQYIRMPDERSPLLADIVYAFGFSIIFVAASITASRTGFLLDRTRSSTYAQAASSAAVQARTVERRRFDGLIHDNVMSTLLAASRDPVDVGVVTQAKVALAELDSLRDETSGTVEFAPPAVMAHLRDAAATVDDSVQVTFTVVDDAVPRSIPAETVRTVGAAMAEALRNSVRHGGNDASRTVDVRLSAADLTVVVADDGRGFDPRAVPSHRLGVRVSILDRMERLAGGSVSLRSSVGRGTRVELRWSTETA